MIPLISAGLTLERAVSCQAVWELTDLGWPSVCGSWLVHMAAEQESKKACGSLLGPWLRTSYHDFCCIVWVKASHSAIAYSKEGFLILMEWDINSFWNIDWACLVAQMVKNLPAMQGTQVQFLGWEDPLEKGMTTHSSILAWRIPWTEEPGGLQSMGSYRVRHDWVTNTVIKKSIGCCCEKM